MPICLLASMNVRISDDNLERRLADVSHLADWRTTFFHFTFLFAFLIWSCLKAGNDSAISTLNFIYIIIWISDVKTINISNLRNEMHWTRAANLCSCLTKYDYELIYAKKQMKQFELVSSAKTIKYRKPMFTEINTYCCITFFHTISSYINVFH